MGRFQKAMSVYSRVRDLTTVDGRNPAPPGMYKTL